MTANYPPVPPEELERYSSALTLSDMEIFVFPDLLYSLVLANILSPRLWTWRQDPWFERIGQLSPYRRVLRLKQYIIDHYEFNLDLDTWGLTTKERELARFRRWMDEATIAQSNALFGYEGDKYYFSLDIRRHFGLDKYNDNVIPYWKTETLEAMDAFRYREGYRTGAGECVSLSTLYAAALFVVCGVPLEDIFLMGTPLHSQNFVDIGNGFLTNNRRVLTKAMWFNGTELTAKAQRALRHEQITVVAHSTGWVHAVYPEATMDPREYERFRKRLRAFLRTEVNLEILLNFLRQHSELQKCFQIMHVVGGHPRWIPAEKVYSYEHSSPFKVSDRTREKLLDEIEADEFFPEPLEGRIPLNRFEEFFRQNRIDLDREEDVRKLVAEFTCVNLRAPDIVRDLIAFVRLEPRFPRTPERFVSEPVIELRPEMSREEILDYLESLRRTSRVADLAFYAYRDLARCDWAPFIKAAMERSPVSIERTRAMDDEALIGYVGGLPNESIYDGTRVAQPDEVINFGRGDGLEKAFCLANVWKARHPEAALVIECKPDRVRLSLDQRTLEWPSSKGLSRIVQL